MQTKVLLALITIALVTLACGISIDLPLTELKTGPTQTLEINVPSLDDPYQTALLTLDFGAGSLNIEPGAKDGLVDGTATFNVADFRPEVTIDGSQVHIAQGNLELYKIPTFSDEVVNRWDLVLGEAPMELVINAGAYAGRFTLGGLALSRLEINDGAADVSVTFSEPNLTEMSLFKYSTGASSVTLEGLANTHAAEMIFRSGAGSYSLDFSGDLTRPMTVRLESGMSSVTVIMPVGVSAVVNSSGGMLNVTPSGGWQQDGSNYRLEGDTPTITINVEMGAGSLVLETR